MRKRFGHLNSIVDLTAGLRTDAVFKATSMSTQGGPSSMTHAQPPPVKRLPLNRRLCVQIILTFWNEKRTANEHEPVSQVQPGDVVRLIQSLHSEGLMQYG